MNWNEKLITLALSAVMVFAMAACADSASEISSPTSTFQDIESQSATPGDDQNSPLKIAVVTSPNTVDDGSFNEDNYNGILHFIASRGNIDEVTPVQESTGDSAAAVQTVADIVADYDVLVCAGFQFAGITTIAQENPDKKFILVDSFPTDDSGAEVELDNIYAMQFAEQESGFFAGIAAAISTQSCKVAVVNGEVCSSNVNYQLGFESGVNYANTSLGSSAQCVELPSYAGIDADGTEVGGNYVGSFSDQATGKILGNTLIKEGCDVIFVAAGNSGNGVFTAAKEADGVKIIGCDVDQYDDGANSSGNIVLTSVLKNMRINVERQLNAIVDGTFKGRNVELRADTDSTGYVSDGDRQQLSDEVLAALADAYEQVKSGAIIPASSSNGYTTKDFPGLEYLSETCLG